MNYIAKEILSKFGIAKHYGVSVMDGAPGRGSGRYPKGSGEKPNQHSGTDFVGRVKELRKQGMSEKDIAIAVGLKNTSELRVQYSNAVNQQRAARVTSAKAMLQDGQSQAEVARHFGINESTLRSWLDKNSEAKMNQAQATADFLRDQVNKKGMIDVGVGVELELGISREKMKQALYILEEEGYPTYGGGAPQPTNPGKQTNMMILCPPGTEHKEIYNYDKINSIVDYKSRIYDDGSEHFEKGFEFPASMDSSRLEIKYKHDILPNGHEADEDDGTVAIRPGCPDLDLGESRYAQVRILVNEKKYIKGMGYYGDPNDFPEGKDVIFYTNKTPDQADRVLKDIKKDPNNPFGALLKEEGGQYHYLDKDGEWKLGLINKTREEGDWGEWSHELPSQFLAKQSKQLIEKQLSLSLADKESEYNDICSLTNPTVKKHLLETFANDCDSASVHLQAAALPRQQYQVILPVATMKDNEVFAPNYHNGETVALIRFPHGTTSEIPILKVNNKQADAIKMMGNAPADAIGINKKVADRLSGADFDGDTVLVIPCNSPRSKVKIVSTPPLKGLEGFDPKMEYGYSDVKETIDSKGETVKHYYRNGHEFKVMNNTQNEMGQISNLITDMTLKGAKEEEIARAVRHSMVVIDAEKHKLDYKQSELDNHIDALKRKYQEHYVEGDDNPHYGASTLISRAKSPTAVLKRKGSPKINQEGKPWYDPDKPEGALIYKSVREEYVDKYGKKKIRTQDSTQMEETTDARKLSSGTLKEAIYADYANNMKALANKARMEIVHTGKIEYSKSAKEAYRSEVDDLMIKLNKASKNAPRERMAIYATNSEINAMKQANRDMTKKEIKKKKAQALARYRIKYGAERYTIDISPKQWEAIQAGAVSETTLSKILRFADIDQVRNYATPRTYNTVSTAKQNKIAAMKNSGYSTAEIAEAVGVSTSTVKKYMD